MVHPAHPACSHTHHLFSHPLCSSQSLLRRIANIFFHVFTFGIPLAAYCVISCTISIKASIHHANQANLAIQPVRSYLDEKGLPARKEAFEYACSLMQGQDLSSSAWFGEKLSKNEQAQYTYERYSGLNPPINPAIAFLAGYERDHLDTLSDDQKMKLAYVIGCLMLEELPQFIKKYPTYMGFDDAEHQRTLVAALTRQDSYQYKLFFDCPVIYNHLRTKKSASEKEFYTQGTMQFNWRALYNDYCDRVNSIVSEKDLSRGDERHAAWIGKDLSSDAYKKNPNSIPS